MLLGIDFGKKRIGLALGEVIPRGIGVLDGTKPQSEIIEEISKICQENGIEKIVIGLPILGSGDEGNLASSIKEFGEKLGDATSALVLYEEEQYTSAEAERILVEGGVKYDRKEGKVDEMAAILILEQYINNSKMDHEPFDSAQGRQN